MRLTGILKEKFEKANSVEVKKQVLVEVGIELTDEELESIAGGETGYEIFFY